MVRQVREIMENEWGESPHGQASQGNQGKWVNLFQCQWKLGYVRVFPGSGKGQERFLTGALFKEVQQTESAVKSWNILSLPKLVSSVLGCRNLWRVVLSVKAEFSMGESKRSQNITRVGNGWQSFQKNRILLH